MVLFDERPRDLGSHPVLELIRQRKRDGSRPGDRTDDAKVALVIEGGGMRGVVSAGMVTALHELDLRDTFDMVIGASAGALAGAYFLAREPQVGTTIYYEDLIDRKWLSYRRALKKSPILSFDYLFEELIADKKELDVDGVLSSGIPLYAVATRVPQYESVLLGGTFAGREELVAALRASARLPIIAGKPESLRCGDYIDGSLTEGIPISSAGDTLGATHMLVLLTRPRGQTRRDPGSVARLIGFRAMNRFQRGLGDICATRAPRYREELDRLYELQAEEAGEPTAMAIQLPPEAETIGLLEQDKGVLRMGAEAGADAVRNALSAVRREPAPDLVMH